MPDGLKKELGLGEPKSPEAPAQGSTEQADKFKAAFQASLQKVNGNLQYTAVHAEDSKHNSQAGKRDKTCSAYQVALGKIDPTNPSAAQGAIDQVLKAVDGLGSAAESFKENVEKAFNAWTEKQGDFDSLQDKVREMVEWGHEKADALQKVVQGVAEKANAKKYEESCTVFDGLSGKAQPIIEDYTKQVEAEEKYNAKLPEVEPELEKTKVECENEDLKAKKDAITTLWDQIKESAAGKAFVTALESLGKLTDQIAEYLKELEEIQKKKEEYEKAAMLEQGNFTKAKDTKTGEPKPHFKLEQAKENFTKAKKALVELEDTQKWEEALAKLPEVAGLAKTLIDLRKGYDDYKAEEGKVQSDITYLENLRWSCPPNDAWNAELTLFGNMLNNFHQGNFDQAIKDMKSVTGKVAELKKRVAKADKEGQPKADAAEKEIRKLAGDKDVSTLSDTEKAKFVEELRKLKPEKQRQLLEDLHGTSSDLTAEQREMQISMYNAMELDKDFKKADKAIRETYQKQLQNDTELKEAVKNWKKTDKDGNPMVDFETKKKMFQKVLEKQSKAYGIDVPEIEWFAGPSGRFGSFSASTTRMRLNTRYLDNPEEMINTIIHENTHNFQDELVKKYIAGKIKKGDPMYEQARTFAVTHHMDAYVPHSEDKKAYKAQPEEMQAWDAGDNEAKKLVDSFKPKP